MQVAGVCLLGRGRITSFDGNDKTLGTAATEAQHVRQSPAKLLGSSANHKTFTFHFASYQELAEHIAHLTLGRMEHISKVDTPYLGTSSFFISFSAIGYQKLPYFASI